MQHIKRMRRIMLPSVTVWLYNILPHYLVKGTIFVKKLYNIKCVFWFSLQLLYEMFLILRRNDRDIITNVRRYPLFLSDFDEIEFSRHSFKKYWNFKLGKNRSSVSRVVSCLQTEKQTDISKLLVAFHNFANAAYKKLIRKKPIYGKTCHKYVMQYVDGRTENVGG